MGFTNYPHGITSFGVPIIGSGVSYGMDYGSTIYFVDDKNGSDSNTGTSPEAAFDTIGAAISAANAWDVIYIAPKAWTSLEYSYPGLNTAYAESNTITYAKAGLAVIGIAHADLRGKPHGVVIRETASSTAANMKVYAPLCAFENLCFERGGTETGGQLTFEGGTALTKEGNGGTVYNCHFFYGNGTTAHSGGGWSGYAGAISAGQVWGLTVDTCYFLGCRIGIQFISGTATAGDFIARNNIFASRLASPTEIDADIVVYTQGSGSITIIHNIFAHRLPACTATGYAFRKYVNVDSERQGIIAFNMLGNDSVLTVGPTDATGITCTDTIGRAANFCTSALCLDSE